MPDPDDARRVSPTKPQNPGAAAMPKGTSATAAATIEATHDSDTQNRILIGVVATLSGVAVWLIARARLGKQRAEASGGADAPRRQNSFFSITVMNACFSLARIFRLILASVPALLFVLAAIQRSQASFVLVATIVHADPATHPVL